MHLKEALRDVDPRLLQTPEGRRLITKHDPLMFAAIYLPHKLYDPAYETISDVTLNDFHLDVIEYAKSWTKRLDIKNKQHDCFIAPRMCGKSTWLNHILPLWAGAHVHKRYLLAFSDSDTQAQKWLGNFKLELGSNERLAEDFPDFIVPKKLGGRDYLDNRNVTFRGNGFIFQVAGADNNVAGANINGQRPEVLLFDDVEPTESNYSDHEVRKRRSTILSGHFYLNIAAIKVFIGTTTMPDSIIDQMRKVNDNEVTYRAQNEWDKDGFRNFVDPEYRWVVENNIRTHYWPAIVENDGLEESLWPEKWSMDYLNEHRGTREFQMNMQNRPVGLNTGFWDDDTIEYDELKEYGNTIISIDPAVTTNKGSDFTGIAVVSRGADDRLYVRHAEGTRKNSVELREHVDDLIEKFGAKVVYVETNQGGDLWKQVFTGVKAKLRTVHQKDKKEVRAGKAFDYYVKGKVVHTASFPTLEEQMVVFPSHGKDDVLDAVVSAVLYFNTNSGRVRVREYNYLEENG